MRKTIAITTREKKKDGANEVRLFSMTDRQAGLFEACIRALTNVSKRPLEQCAAEVERAIVKLLGGKMPVEHAPRIFLDLRQAFPILRPKDVRKLPRAGCPRGRIEGLVLQTATKDGEKRTVLVKLDRDQTNFYNDAIRECWERDGCSKDDAWLWVNNLIGQLLAGAELKEKTDEMLLMRAVNLFPGLTEEEAKALPLATEDDVRKYSFTLDRAH